MFAIPTPDEIRSVAHRFGIRLEADDLDRYQAFLLPQLAALEAFVQNPADESEPPLLFPERAPGHRPTRAEDPYNAWLWKCQIGGTDGVLAGKRVSYKDHISVAGIPLTFGAFALDRLIPDVDATIVTRVLASGGTITGKNTLSGFSGIRGLGGALGDYWEPVNPHRQGRLTGGSSSGSAVAVAAGEVDISFGGDQGGSIRVPAAWCGVVGLKPTFGLVSHMGAAYGGDPSLDHVGPLTRTVEDAAAALDAVAGYDGYDPRQGRGVPDAYDSLTGLDRGVDGLRIGVLEEGFAEPIEPEVLEAVDAALSVLERAGAHLVPMSVPEHADAAFPASVLLGHGYRAVRGGTLFGAGAKTYYPTSVIRAVSKYWSADADEVTGFFKMNLVLSELAHRRFHGAVYAKAHNVRPALVRAYDAALANVDVLAMPTCLAVAPPAPEPSTFAEALHHDAEMLAGRMDNSFEAILRNTMPFSYTGHPALAVPCGKPAGLPVSLQLVGRFFDDARLLRTAYAFEHSIDWEALVGVDH